MNSKYIITLLQHGVVIRDKKTGVTVCGDDHGTSSGRAKLMRELSIKVKEFKLCTV